MKLIHTKNNIKFVVVFLFLSQLTFAQTTLTPEELALLGFEDNVQDVTAPIDAWLVPTLVVGLLVMFFFYQKQIKKQQY